MASKYDEGFYFSYPSHAQGVSRSGGSAAAAQNGRMGPTAFNCGKSIAPAPRVASGRDKNKTPFRDFRKRNSATAGRCHRPSFEDRPVYSQAHLLEASGTFASLPGFKWNQNPNPVWHA